MKMERGIIWSTGNQMGNARQFRVTGLDIGYLCKMFNSSLKKRLFLTPNPKLIFYFTMKKASLRETKEIARCPIRYVVVEE